MLAGQVPAPPLVLDLILHVLDGAGFLAMPLEQLGPVPFPIGNHRVVMSVGAIGEERTLRLEQAQPHVAHL